jgi:thymidine kinase
MTLITIDGNIGCGKTGVLNYLHKSYRYPIDLEPVDNWQEDLNLIYNDMNNNNNLFNFQVKIWLDRCWIQNNIDSEFVLVERSPAFIKNIFIKYAYDNNIISKDQNDILEYLHNKTNHIWKDNVYIYLRSNPESCMTRIKKRNRKSEDKIKLEYLNDINNLHNEYYDKLKSQNINIHIIDVENKNINMIANEVKTIIDKIKKNNFK